MARGHEELCMVPSPGESVDVRELLKRQRSHSSTHSDSGVDGLMSSIDEEPMSYGSPVPSPGMYMRQRSRYTSESEASLTSQVSRLLCFISSLLVVSGT